MIKIYCIKYIFVFYTKLTPFTLNRLMSYVVPHVKPKLNLNFNNYINFVSTMYTIKI